MIIIRKEAQMTRRKRYICIILAAALLACVPGDISSLTGIGKSAKDGKAVYSPVARAADGEEITDPENQPAAQAKAKPRPMKELVDDLGKATGNSVKSFNSDTDISKLKSGRALIKYVKQLRKSSVISFVVIDVNTGEGFGANPRKKMYSASCLKGPYVAALCKYKPYSYSRSRSLMRSTVTVSNNDTYASLRKRYGHSPMRKLRSLTKATSFDPDWKYTYIRTRDLARLWVGTYWYFYRDKNKNSIKCRRMYTHGTQSFIYRGLKSRAVVHTKPGWYPGGGLNVQNDAGIVMAKYKGDYSPYIISVMTTANGQHKKLRKLVRLIDDVHRDMYRLAQ